MRMRSAIFPKDLKHGEAIGLGFIAKQYVDVQLEIAQRILDFKDKAFGIEARGWS